MGQNISHLNALKVVEVVARHRSIRRAAQELNVTPAAVSHQIKKLEDFLDVALFQRTGRNLSPTQAALSAMPMLQDGFQSLSAAVQQMRDSHARRVVKVLSAPSFAAKWLVPRLARFNALHGGIDIEVAASNDLIGAQVSADSVFDALKRRVADIAIPFSLGQFPGCAVAPLLPAALVPLCSPGLLQGRKPLRRPEDLRHHTLLHDDTDYAEGHTWSDWFTALGLAVEGGGRELHFNQSALALEAAIEGQGVVLSLEPLAAAEIAAGRLVVPFAGALRLEHAYHLVSLPVEQPLPDLAAFSGWLVSEAGAHG